MLTLELTKTTETIKNYHIVGRDFGVLLPRIGYKLPAIHLTTDYHGEQYTGTLDTETEGFHIYAEVAGTVDYIGQYHQRREQYTLRTLAVYDVYGEEVTLTTSQEQDLTVAIISKCYMIL